MVVIFLVEIHITGQPYYFDRYSSADGLSSVVISDIVQDSTGFIWIGTQDGLNRFDGHNFRVYKNIPNQETSLNDNLIRSLHIDQNGTLWIGTRKGAARYDPVFDRFSRLPGLLFGNQNNDKVRVYEIVSDKRNHIWIGMQENGIFHYNPGTNLYTHYHARAEERNQLDSDFITGLYYDIETDIVWFTTIDGGLQCIILPEGKVERFESINSEILDNNTVSGIFPVKEKNTDYLWLQSYRNLYKVPRDIQSAKKAQPCNIFTANYQRSINDVIQTGTNNTWVGGAPLIQYQPEDKTIHSIKHSIFEPSSISDNNITCLYYDSFEVLWVGTENGLNKLDTRRKAFTFYSQTAKSNDRLPTGEVQAIYQDSHGTLWIGIRNNGLYIKRGIQNKHIPFKNNELQGFSGKNITSFLEDNEGRLWIGIMGGGLNMIEDPENVWKKDPTFQYFRVDQPAGHYLNTWNVRCITQENEHSFWIGTLNGIKHVTFIEENSSIEIDSVHTYSHISGNDSSLIGDLVNDIYIDGKKNVWVATSQGLSFLPFENRERGIFTNFFPDIKKNTISQNSVKKIFEGDTNTLWFATQGGGLFKYNMGLKKFKNYTSEEGLSGSIIWGIQEDKRNNLWLSTNAGLWLFNTSLDTFRNFSTSDGLQNIEFSEFSSFKNKDGEIFFGGKNGLIRFHPDSIEDNPIPPRVAITSLRIFNQKIEVGDTLNGELVLDSAISQKRKLILSHKHNDFSFEFIGLHFASPDQNRYKYIMEGYDKTWKTAGAENRVATYTNLPPGKYVFKINASNNDGVWCNSPDSMVVQVSPPFWFTWWAYLIYLIIITSIFFLLLYFFRLRQKWQNELELDKLKLQFFTNISHEFRTPLTLILGPLERLIEKRTAHENTLKMIKSNALKLQQLINQILDIRKVERGTNVLEPEPGDIVTFTKDIVALFYPLADQKKHHLSFKSDQQICHVNFDKEKLEKVIINIVSNAFKYTPDGGAIEVRVNTKKKNHVEISIKDSGVGMSRRNITRIFERFYQIDQSVMDGFGIGLALSYELIKLHRGKIEVESRTGEGSNFRVIIPSNLQAVKKETKTAELAEKKPEPFFEQETEEEEFPVDPDNSKPLIMVIDDNKDMRLYLRDYLMDKYQVRLAAKGETGIQEAIEKIPDLIISDVMMPGMDGYKLSSRLKTDIRTSHIPVILLTARQSEQSHKQGLETGADDYITKPFNMELLRLRIQNLLDNRQRVHRFFHQNSNSIEVDDLDIGAFDKNFLDKAFKTITSNIDNEHFSVEEFAGEMALSRTQLYRKIKALTGKTPNRLIKISRMTRAAEMLREKQMTVSEVAYKTGFKDIAHFSRSFQQFFGKNPSEFRKLSG